MADTNTIVQMSKLIAQTFTEESWPYSDRVCRGASEDMQDAYDQVPLSPSNVALAVEFLYDPDVDAVAYFIVYGQPQGAEAAVPNFYRVAETLCRICRRLFALVLEHMFDDFFLVEPEWSAASGVMAFRRCCKALGVELSEEKSQCPTELFESLGVVHDYTQQLVSNKLLVLPKPLRVDRFVQELRACRAKDDLQPELAGRLVGKYGFLCGTHFGRCGRVAQSGLRARQYQSADRPTKITETLGVCLDLAEVFALECPPRMLDLSLNNERVTVLYCDASEEDEGRVRRVGAVLDSPRAGRLLWTAVDVPQATVDALITKKKHITQIEAIADVIALDTWAPLLARAPVIVFCDNDAASAALINGYSRKDDLCRIAGDFWLRAATLEAAVWIDRVESGSNIADGPSRNDSSVLDTLGAVFVEPCIDYFDQIRVPLSPREWFKESSCSWFWVIKALCNYQTSTIGPLTPIRHRRWHQR